MVMAALDTRKSKGECLPIVIPYGEKITDCGANVV